MDDLFQYLIWGIIIFSFLSSFFKKKEPPKQTPTQRNQRADSNISLKQGSSSKPEVITQKRDEYDILKEIENLFKGEMNIPQTKPRPVKETFDYSEHETKNKYPELADDKRFHRSVEDKKPIGARKTYDENIISRKTVKGQTKAASAKIEAEARKFEQILAGQHKQKTGITDFQRKLKNSVSIKEYILFSEILGKPKALRR